MTPKHRVAIALRGGKPDRVPIVPIYDVGYVTRSLGLDERARMTATPEEWDDIVERNFLLHEVDGFFVHGGSDGLWIKDSEIVERRPDYWLVRVKATGEMYRLLPNGWHAKADGTPVQRDPSSGGVSQIQSLADIDRVVGPPPTEADIEATGRWRPLRRLASKYPDHHFSFQSGSPMPMALGSCGGFVEALTTMASDRDLFRALLARCAEHQCARMAAGRAAGADSTWFTSYYTGADTISPRDYADLVFPFEYRICKAARDAGLYVLNWFLGDLTPILDKVMELPMDALVLEQGRKGYEIDPVAIRKRVGPKFCLFGFGFENDYCTFNREGLAGEITRQYKGAGRKGAFVAGTPIMPPNAIPAAVDYYFEVARGLGR